MNSIMKIIALLLFYITFSSLAFAQENNKSLAAAQELAFSIESPPDAQGIFAIYPGNGVPKGSENWTWEERTIPVDGDRMARNIVIPTVTLFKPASGKANGTAVIVAPGGAFHFLMMEKEGYEVARWLANLGITAFVLKYRVEHTPESDAELQPFLAELFQALPRQNEKEVDPPVGTPGALLSYCCTRS
jgi:acetyl esterase/lipase